MTKASEVTVSDEEARRFFEQWQREIYPGSELLPIKKALAAFLAARMPDAKPKGDFALDDLCDLAFDSGHNALRAAVLRGPG